MKKTLKKALRIFVIVVIILALYLFFSFMKNGGEDAESGDIASVIEETADRMISENHESDRESDSEKYESENDESETDSGRGAQTDSEHDSETDLSTETDSDSSDSDTEPESDIETDSYSETDYEPYDGDPVLILVNRDHSVPAGYEVDLVELDGGCSIDMRAYPDLMIMFEDMRAVGLSPIVVEGYRTREYQQEIMDQRIDEYILQGYSEEGAAAEAEKWVAVPGTSEHELGLAVDINGDGWGVYEWLAENAYKYGFILRYPSGKEGITGIDYEPWHYRFVGREAAEEIYSEGVCLEEYLDEL